MSIKGNSFLGILVREFNGEATTREITQRSKENDYRTLSAQDTNNKSIKFEKEDIIETESNGVENGRPVPKTVRVVNEEKAKNILDSPIDVSNLESMIEDLSKELANLKDNDTNDERLERIEDEEQKKEIEELNSRVTKFGKVIALQLEQDTELKKAVEENDLL
jgi:hypothetical protein